jgi:hypothetical protein
MAQSDARNNAACDGEGHLSFHSGRTRRQQEAQQAEQNLPSIKELESLESGM